MSTTTTPHIWRPSNSRRVTLDGLLPVPRGTLPAAAQSLSWPAKDPSDVLDYEFDVTTALLGNAGDAIASVDVTVTPNAQGDLTVTGVACDGAVAVIWFTAGQAGTVYTVQISVTTLSGRVIGRAVFLPVQSLAAGLPPPSLLTTDQGAVVTDQNGSPILLGS